MWLSFLNNISWCRLWHVNLLFLSGKWNLHQPHVSYLLLYCFLNKNVWATLCNTTVKHLILVDHDLRGHNAIFSSSMAHSYVAYVGPAPLTTSRSSNNVDDPHVNPHWNVLSGQNEIFTPHAFPAVNLQYTSWGRQPPPFSISTGQMNVAEPTSTPHATLRSSHGESDAAPIPRSFLHPLVFDHG